MWSAVRRISWFAAVMLRISASSGASSSNAIIITGQVLSVSGGLTMHG